MAAQDNDDTNAAKGAAEDEEIEDVGTNIADSDEEAPSNSMTPTEEEPRKALHREVKRREYQKRKSSGAHLLKNLHKRLTENNTRLSETSDPPTHYKSRSDTPEESLELGAEIKRYRAAIEKQIVLYRRLASWNDPELVDGMRSRVKSWQVGDVGTYVAKLDGCLEALRRKANPVSVTSWLDSVTEEEPPESREQRAESSVPDEANREGEVLAADDRDAGRASVALADGLGPPRRKREASESFEDARRRRVIGRIRDLEEDLDLDFEMACATSRSRDLAKSGSGS